MSSYKLPKWAKLPPTTSKWTLDEIKSGTLVKEHSLSSAVTTFGREPTLFSVGEEDDSTTSRRFQGIVTAHLSCSRLHARIAFDPNGVPWLRDLESANSTFVNKKQVPRASIGKVECEATCQKDGSRGVRLFPGDVIILGASTRFFVLNYNGPDNTYDRDSVRLSQKLKAAVPVGVTDAANAVLTTSSTGEKENHESMQPQLESDFQHGDHEDNSESSSPFILPSDPLLIPMKHRPLHEKLTGKKYKLSNIETEMQRIEAKSSAMELTAGQMSQLEKLKERSRILSQTVDTLQDELQKKLNGDSGGGGNGKSKSSSRRKRNEEDEDVDSFYDMTSKRQKKNNSSNTDDSDTVETEESLVKKFNAFISRKRTLLDHAQKFSRQKDEIQAEIKGATDEDLFFHKNDLEICNSQIQTNVNDVAVIDKELDSIESLIKVVNPKLCMNRNICFVGTNAEVETEKGTKEERLVATRNAESTSFSTDSGYSGSCDMPPPPSMLSTKTNNKHPSKQKSESMPPPMGPIQSNGNSTLKPASPVHSENGAITLDTTTTTMAPPPFRKIRGPMGPSNTIQNSIEKQRSKNPSKIKASPAPQGTLSTLFAATSSSNSNFKGEQIPKKDNPKTEDSNIFQSRKDEWVAPKGQDGSGITKLNAKFAGRY